MLVKRYKFLLYLFLALPCALNDLSAQEIENTIRKHLDSSKNKTISKAHRRNFALKAYQLFNEQTKSEQHAQQITNIAFAFYSLKDSSNFRKANREARVLSSKQKDSLNLANNYWDLGDFLSKRGVKDSAYWSFSSAQKLFSALDSSYFSGRMLLNMAIIQSNVRDYTGSEITTMEAIEILKPLDENRHLYRAYNNLAVNFNGMDDYEKALYYHKKALEFQKKIDSENTLGETALNNIGFCYQKQEKYRQAIENYDAALENKNLKNLVPSLYAKLIDNRAYCTLKLMDTTNIRAKFYEAQSIRDSIKDVLGQTISMIHLAEFHLFKGDTLKAIELTKTAKILAQKSDNNSQILASLILLSKIDAQDFSVYTNEYIALRDNLLKEERVTRNKFARIRFETDETIEKNIKLDEQNLKLNRQRRVLLMVTGFTALIGLLLFIIKYQQNKNRELRFQRGQQKANEEIYKLMISQQNKMDEGSRNEKHRISKELHDGVLGRLFGTRLLLGTINAKNDEDTVAQREKYIDELQSIEEEIRNISHELHADAQIKNIGYPSLVESLLDSQSKIGQFDATLENDENIGWEQIDGGIKMHVYRILQEGLQNITKYAQAKRVAVKFSLREATLHIQIIDDGVGFDTDSKNKGIGLTNIRSRINNLAGSFEVTSTVGSGTILDLNIPITTVA